MQLSAVITDDAVVLGLLLLILSFVFYTSSSKSSVWVKFYKVVPTLLLCYFLPSLFNSFGIIDGEKSGLYPVIRDFLLPASLVLLTSTVDISAVKKLGAKAIIMFLAGSVGVMVGGPLAVWLFTIIDPKVVGGAGSDAVWRGLTAIAGSWIGGGANQAAMKEIFKISDNLFSAMITVDVMTAYVWMAFLLYGASIAPKLDKKLKADSSAIENLRQKMELYHSTGDRNPSLTDLVLIAGVGFGVTGFAHLCADWIAPFIELHAPGLARFSLTTKFFWLILIATFVGIALSFTKVRDLDHAGASKTGTLLLYVLVATLGMKMNIFAIFDNPKLLLVAFTWLAFHILFMIGVAKLIKAPFFFVAVGSQANIGGPASAPIVAAAFSPSLAPVGVLLAVLGYAIGTGGAYITGLLMQWVVER
jgi:uncharacterized membrane protein